MIILAVDTSGPVCGVALAKDEQILYEAAAVNKRTHSASLMPMVAEALSASGPAHRGCGSICRRNRSGIVYRRADRG